MYLAAAIDFVEVYTGRKLSQTGETTYFDCFGDLELKGDDPESIVVNYVDANGADQVVTSSVYDLKTHKIRGYLTLAYNKSWPSVRSQDAAINVVYNSGYVTVPGMLKAGVLIEAATDYEYRENETVVKLTSRKTVERLIEPYRVYTL